jgi:hypothetical protein
MLMGFYPGSLLLRFVGMRTGWSWAAAVYSLKTHSFLPQRLGEGLGHSDDTKALISFYPVSYVSLIFKSLRSTLPILGPPIKGWMCTASLLEASASLRGTGGSLLFV